jgi:single-stranded-DNA-specific exonuclease
MIRVQWQVLEETQATSVEEVIEILLTNRGVAPSFLSCALKDLEPHLAMQGMDEGAELMARHLCAGHKIVLVGDYDCDGVTSVAQMSLFLRDIGYRNYEVVIPVRTEGYGMPERAVVDHPDARLFVIMDCGTLDVKAVTMARDLGADCIVIDHHEVPEEGLAPATVLINPKQRACLSPFKEFCSSGLTLLFLVRLRRAIQGHFSAPNLGGKYLALAAIGTVADIVPLVEGNRILTSCGLSCINKGTFMPVSRILDTAGLSGKTLTAGHIGYYVGPRINAAGRMAEARLAFDLLTAESSDEITRLTHELNRLNAARQHQEDVILKEIRQRFADEREGKRTLVMGDPKWAAGIIGIIASRIQQELRFGPTIVFFMDEQKGIARGSARSIPGFDIHAALGGCSDLLLKWGGHKMAAGMTVSLDLFEAFARRFEEVAQQHPADVFVPKGKIDAFLDIDLVSRKLLDGLKQLEPHGPGNPTPVFAARNIRVSIQKAFGRDQNHLRLRVGNGIGGIFWRGVRHYESGQWRDGEYVDVVFQVEWDDYSKKPVLNIKDIGHLF